MSRRLQIPCVGGNVSFYNEDEETGRAVKPTTTVVMLGLIERLEWVTTLGFKEPGSSIILVGKTYPELGGSEYYHEIHGIDGGRPPKASWRREKATIKTVMEAIRSGLVKAAHDCSKGGLAIALALMSIKGCLGAKVDLRKIPSANVRRLDELLFSETYARIILEVERVNARKVLRIASKNGAPAAVIGEVSDSGEFILHKAGKPVVGCSLDEMSHVWRSLIPSMMEGVKV